MNKIPIQFKVTYMQADKTEYMQRSVELEPYDLSVVIELDPDPQLFWGPEVGKYFEEQKLFELGQGEKPKPLTLDKVILTPKGIAKVREMINEVFEVRHPYAENHKDDWDDGEEGTVDDW